MIVNFDSKKGSNLNPGLIPRTLDLLFESLRDNLEVRKCIYQFKPDKFNEICSLNEDQLNQELSYKETILRLSGAHSKDLERTDSLESLTSIGSSASSLLEASKKFGSLDSLSTVLSSNTSDINAPLNNPDNLMPSSSSAKHIRIPPNKKYSIWISFYELYNDNVFDLLTLPNKLVRPGDRTDRPPLKIREDSNRIPYVEGLVYIPVSILFLEGLKTGLTNFFKGISFLDLR